MSYFLSFDCSLPSAEVSLLKQSEKSLQLLVNSRWTHKAFQSTHSDRLSLEIDRLLKKAKISLEDLNGIAVGVGPGRFTGVRTAVTTAKALSFSLKIPVYPVNSLKILAEEFYGKTTALFVSLYAFKNQIYFAEFYSQTEQVFVLSFEQWQEKMQSLSQTLRQEKIICVSDVERFYHLEPHLKQRFLFKKPKLSGFNLVKILLREKTQAQNWLSLKANYLRAAV